MNKMTGISRKFIVTLADLIIKAKFISIFSFFASETIVTFEHMEIIDKIQRIFVTFSNFAHV